MKINKLKVLKLIAKNSKAISNLIEKAKAHYAELNLEEKMSDVKDALHSISDKDAISIKKMKAYHDRALAIASQSHDSETKVGAILINRKTLAVTAEGYNGFVRGGPDSVLPTSRPEKYNYMIHAETNLLCNAVRSGVQTDEAIVYCTLSPCTHCLRMLWQAGVSEFYFKEKYKDFDQCTSMLDLEAKVKKHGSFYKMIIRPRR